MTEVITKQSPWNKGLKTGPLTEKHRNHISEALQGHSVSEETRKKISLAQCGEKNHRYGKSPWNKGKTGIYSEETLERNAEAHRGLIPWNKGLKGAQVHSEETRRRMSEAKRGEKHHMYGKHLSEEHRRNLSKAKQGTLTTEETKRKISEAHRGRIFTEEHRHRISESKFGKTRSEEERARMSAGHQGISYEEWTGFVSLRLYCEKFNEPLKEHYRNAYGRICVYCGRSELFHYGRLSVHHIDGNKDQGCDENDWFLIPLCRSCNAKRFERKPEYVFLFWLKDIERKHRGGVLRK